MGDQRNNNQYYPKNPKPNFNPQDQSDQINYQPSMQNDKDFYKNVNIPPPEKPIDKTKNFNFNIFKFIRGLIRLIIKFLRTIKNLLITILILFVVSTIILIFVLVNKPPFLWNPLKTFVNNEISIVNSSAENVDQIYAMINEKGKKDSVVTLTESQFSKIAFTNLVMPSEDFIRFSQDKIIFYLNTDTKERPLWAIFSIDVRKGEKLKIQSFGFGRFNTPQFFSGLLNDTLGTFYTFAEKLVTADNNVLAFNQMLANEKLDKTLVLKEVKIEDGRIVLTYLKNNSDSSQY